MTPEQEAFLVKFADKGIEAEKAETARIAAVEREREINGEHERILAERRAHLMGIKTNEVEAELHELAKDLKQKAHPENVT